MRPTEPRPDTSGPDDGPEPPYPAKLSGEVIAGFGRGSKELGIPTANIPCDGLPTFIVSGIYYGWAGLSLTDAESGIDSSASISDATSGVVLPMVMSVGWNPFYKNEVRSVEVHIMHKFPKDFYGAKMNLLIMGYIRPEFDYVSKEALIDDINKDIDIAHKSLARPAYAQARNDEYLVTF